MTELHTDESLLHSLKEAARKKMTSAELYNQQVSFIMGSLDETSDVSRDRIDQVLATLECREAS